MAEMLFKIGDSANGRWHDRDVVVAPNNARIRREHCVSACFEKRGEPVRINGILTRRFKRETKDGLLPVNDVAADFCEATHEYRRLRTGKRSFEIIRIADGEKIAVTNDRPFEWFDGRMVACDIDRHIFARDKHGKKGYVFGQVGNEIEYGGRMDFSAAKIEQVVPALKNKLGIDLDEPQYELWPWGHRSIREFVPVRVVDFSQQEAEALIAPQYKMDENGLVYHKVEFVTNQDLAFLSAVVLLELGDDVPDEARAEFKDNEHAVIDKDGLPKVSSFYPMTEAARNIRLESWELIREDLGVTLEQIADRNHPIGVEPVTLRPGVLVSQSKAQPAQAAAEKLWVKSQGRPGEREQA